MNNKRWTNIELLTLGDLYRDGLSYNEIACKLNRSKAAVANAVNVYRDVINVEYRSKGAGRIKRIKRIEVEAAAPLSADTPMADMTPPNKPWWKFWA